MLKSVSSSAILNLTKELNRKGRKELNGRLDWEIKPLTPIIAFVLFVAFAIQSPCVLCDSIL